jgi:hypothetical protein
MDEFPRTTVGGVSVSRMIIGTNWFYGCTHTSAAKDKFISSYQTPENIIDIIAVFMEHGVDTIMGPPLESMRDYLKAAEDRTGRECLMIMTPDFNITQGGKPEQEPEYRFDQCEKLGATFCMPHQRVTDALLDTMHGVIRDIDKYTFMIRERGMIPGLSTHSPETIRVVDKTGADIEAYLQPYNCAGFLMHVEVDWVMRLIKDAKKPVIGIKPFAAGRILPPVALAFVWNAIRDCDMVTVGTTTPDEAREVIELSLDFLKSRLPDNQLQRTRSKQSLD